MYYLFTMATLRPLYQNTTKVYRLTLVDENGDPPVGGTLTWTIDHVLSTNTDGKIEPIIKSNTIATEIAPAPAAVNPNDNVWDIFYTLADTDPANLICGQYNQVTRVTTDTGAVDIAQREEVNVLPKGLQTLAT